MDDDVLDAARRWTDARVAAWSPDWPEPLRAWLDPQLALVGDAEWGAAGRDAVGLPVADPLAWANRRLELADGHWAVTGIRFRGRDVAKPFVDVIATSLTPDAAGLTALGAVLPQYDAFGPLCLRVLLPGDGAVPGLSGAALEPDLRIVAGGVDAIVSGGAGDTGGVDLVRVDPERAAARVEAVYEDLLATRPQLHEWAVPADADDLEDADDEGLLFEVRVDGEAAGVVAAEASDAYGLTGSCVQEIAVDAQHRGAGVGTAALRALATRLPEQPGAVLWGHIHAQNSAALRGAIGSGREVVATHAWLTPDGYAGMPGAR